MSTGKTIADGYIELRLDDSKIEPDVRAKVAKITNTFGSRLNRELKALSIDPIDLQADPGDALRAISETETQLRELARNAPTIDLKIKAEAARAQLGRFTKSIGDIAPTAATGFASKFSQKLGPLLSSMPISPQIVAVVAGAAVAAAPVLAAVLSGAIIGGAGIGGIIGGLAVAARDERVKTAAKTMGDEFQERLEDAGGAFVQPALDGIKRIDDAVRTIDLRRIFADSARYVEPLANGIGSAVESIGDALEGLVSRAGPVIDAIGRGIAQFGTSLSRGLQLLEDNGPEAAAAMELLFDVLSSVTYTTLQTVNALTELFGWLAKIGSFNALHAYLKLTSGGMDEVDKSGRRGAAGTFSMAKNMDIAASKADRLKAAAEELKPVQDAVNASQKALTDTLDQLGGKTNAARLTADSLRTAYQNLFGATINQTEANEAYQESFDALSETVKTNAKQFKNSRDNLDLHTRAGRSNRDALQALLTKNNELYFADIATGKSVAFATQKHKERTAQVVREADKVGLNKRETDKLISTYGRIPGKKVTDLVLDGVRGVVDELKKLYTLQRALALGINVNLVTGTGTVKNFKATGGAINGPGTGTSDDVPIMGSHGEHMWTAKEVRAAGGHSAMHAMRKQVLASAGHAGYYANGGAILTAVDTSRRWPFRTNLDNTKIMSVAEAESKVIPAFGSWPSSPGAQRGDSGVWRRILAAVKASGIRYAFGNSYRPGDPKWHGSGRAIDFMGFEQDRLAQFFMNMKPRVLELIHRTSRRDYGITRGRNARMPTQWPLHRDHLHIAMREGGPVPSRLIPFGAYDSGGRLPTGLSLAYNGTGRPEPVGHGLSGDVHLHFHDSVVASKQAAEDMFVEAYRSAQARRRI